jgi:hypothetical protein
MELTLVQFMALSIFSTCPVKLPDEAKNYIGQTQKHLSNEEHIGNSCNIRQMFEKHI